MFLHEHPKMQPWPPSTDSLACTGSTTPNIHEVPGLRLKNVHVRTPARLVFLIDYAGADCLLIRDFDDREFLNALYDELKNCIGLTLQQIGGRELP